MHHTIIKTARYLSGLSQQEMADYLYVTQSNISKYENGSLKISPKTLNRMKEIFASNGMGKAQLKFIEQLYKDRK